MKYALLIFLFPLCLQAQSVSVSPISFYGSWDASITYKQVGIHYFHSGHEIPHKSTIAISAIPISLHYDMLKMGIIGSINEFPSNGSSKINFIIDLGVSFDKLRVSVKHISNGFGILHRVNPGYNALQLSYQF